MEVASTAQAMLDMIGKGIKSWQWAKNEKDDGNLKLMLHDMKESMAQDFAQEFMVTTKYTVLKQSMLDKDLEKQLKIFNKLEPNINSVERFVSKMASKHKQECSS